MTTKQSKKNKRNSVAAVVTAVFGTALFWSWVQAGGGVTFPSQPQLHSTATVGKAVLISVQAVDSSSSAIAYVWDFGDGSTGTGSTVAHSYSAEGTYFAKVTATSVNGSASASIQIKVGPAVPAGTVSLAGDITGTWTGKISEKVLERDGSKSKFKEEITVTIVQSGSTVTGSTVIEGNTYTLVGWSDGTHVALSATYSGSISGTFVGKLNKKGTALKGNTLGVDGAEATIGKVSLKRVN